MGKDDAGAVYIVLVEGRPEAAFQSFEEARRYVFQDACWLPGATILQCRVTLSSTAPKNFAVPWLVL